MEILKERQVNVIDPFEGEDKLCAKFGEKDYYPNCNYKLGRAIWIKDLKQIRKANMFVLWVPNSEYSYSGCHYELGHAFDRDKFIQIISPLRHPCFAYVLCGGNQQFESVDDFDNLRLLKWRD